jgi:type II secretory pathway pseudopilin PulG
LIEALVIIAILAVLFALLLPAFSRPRERPIFRVKVEMAMIASAIRSYESAYDRLPVSDAVSNLAAAAQSDFTYGAAGLVSNVSRTSWSVDNSEIMAFLFDMVEFGHGKPTVNKGHRLNPQRTKFMFATMAGDTKSPGLGIDGVYRDPWGSPYIITLDMNNDGKCSDALYRLRAVSQQHGADGFNGLANSRDPNGAGDRFEFNGRVMVWSLGPDKSADPSRPANAGFNRDNILSWKQ